VGVIRRKALKDAGAWSGLPGGAQGIAQALETRAINAEVEATRLRQQLKGAVREALTVREAFAVASAEVQACAENGDDPACVRSALSTTAGGQ
jgi:hypothetical protein